METKKKSFYIAPDAEIVMTDSEFYICTSEGVDKRDDYTTSDDNPFS